MAYPTDWPEPGKMHFRLEEDRLGILDLSCDNGYVVQSYNLGFPTVREVTLPNSLDDGNFDVTSFFGPRAVSLDVVLKPHTGSGPHSSYIAPEPLLRDRLLAYTYPALRPRLIFSEHDDDRVKHALIRGAQASVAVSRRDYNKLNVSWVAPRGVFWSWDQRCYTYMFESFNAESDTMNIVNHGSAPAHWRVRITGEAQVKPRFILNGTDILQLDYVSVYGDVVGIESFGRTVTVNGNPVGFKYGSDATTERSSWFTIPPGPSTLTVEHAAYTVTGYPWAVWGPSAAGTYWAGPTVNPPPTPPPWTWTAIDPVSGQPGRLFVEFCFYDAFL